MQSSCTNVITFKFSKITSPKQRRQSKHQKLDRVKHPLFQPLIRVCQALLPANTVFLIDSLLSCPTLPILLLSSIPCMAKCNSWSSQALAGHSRCGHCLMGEGEEWQQPGIGFSETDIEVFHSLPILCNQFSITGLYLTDQSYDKL